MTILSGSPSTGSGSAAQLLTIQCDVCCPPFLATNRLDVLREAGWTTVLDGSDLDVCPICRRRRRPAQLVHRRERPETSATAGGALPNLVVIGAAKCATNSLHAYLDSHPDVSMSVIKEPQFFQDPGCAEWLNFYRAQFDAEAPIRGESSTVYTRDPVAPGVPGRMAALIPGARLVYMVRDPVDRAVSSYVEERMHDNDRRSFDDAFAELDVELNPYVAASMFAAQLNGYLDHYDPSQIIVVDMHDLESQPADTLRRIFTFLDVEPRVDSIDFDVRLNTRDHKREYSENVRRLRRSPLLRAAYMLPERPREAILRPVRQLLSNRLARPELSPALRQRLMDALADDAAELRRITGQPFSNWSV